MATSVIATAQAILLCGLLVLRLQKEIKTDKGMERLKRMRSNHLKEQVVWRASEQKQVVVEESML